LFGETFPAKKVFKEVKCSLGKLFHFRARKKLSIKKTVEDPDDEAMLVREEKKFFRNAVFVHA
jgi:hypothetical protein